MSDCYCSDDGDPDFGSLTMVRARKEHRCCECKDTIKVGETYQRIVGKWDGKMASYATCSSCAELRAELESLIDGSEGICLGSLGCAYQEHLREMDWPR